MPPLSWLRNFFRRSEGSRPAGAGHGSRRHQGEVVQPALERMKLKPDDSVDNPLMMQFFTWDALHDDMSWWEHFEEEIPTLASMGFTQIWLPPPNKAAEKDGRGYDAYDLWDLGQFDQKGSVATRWGTREEFLRACSVAKQHEVDVLIDAVLNHKLGADRYETFQAVPVAPTDRLREIAKPREIQGWTAFDFPGRGGQYSHFTWNHEHFTVGLDWDHKTRTKGIYRITSGRHKGWSHNVDQENGNYDYLLGVDASPPFHIDHRHPDVQKELFNWGAWIIHTTGAGGFRLDAIKHIDYDFLLEFIKKTRRETNPRMFCVAEYWSGNLRFIIPYIRLFRGETAFFDVPLHMKFCEASRKGARFDLSTILNNTLAHARPRDAVTFVDNHDTVEGKELASWVESSFKVQAYALILLRPEGYPCVFYGDLYPNKYYNVEVARSIRRLIEARKRYAYGATQNFLASRNCVGWVRMGDAHHPGCAVLISKYVFADATHTVRMNVGQQNAGGIYTAWMTSDTPVNIDAEGWGVFSLYGSGVQVWARSQ
ncbi:alpha amylase [Fistulina hepatica ATCC 64428]|nr:alpha amylase [Fistulina hepatica ATCC 64428]